MLCLSQIIFHCFHWTVGRWEFGSLNIISSFHSQSLTAFSDSLTFPPFTLLPSAILVSALKLHTKNVWIPKMRFAWIIGLLIPTKREDTNNGAPQIGKVEEKREGWMGPGGHGYGPPSWLYLETALSSEQACHSFLSTSTRSVQTVVVLISPCKGRLLLLPLLLLDCFASLFPQAPILSLKLQIHPRPLLLCTARSVPSSKLRNTVPAPLCHSFQASSWCWVHAMLRYIPHV